MPTQDIEMAEVPVNGKVLQWARVIRGLSIDDAASVLGISPDELRAYESGEKNRSSGFSARCPAATALTSLAEARAEQRANRKVTQTETDNAEV
jgi:predicted transcriptional regulator